MKRIQPEPVITRWRTWLTAVEYYADNFEAVKSFIESLDPKDAESIKKSQKSFNAPNIRQQLTFIKVNFMHIVSGIKILGSNGLELKEYMDVYENVRSKLDMLDIPTFKQKFKDILSRNVEFESLIQIKDALYGNKNGSLQTEYVRNLSPSIMSLFKIAVVTSVDVERTFSTYNLVLTDRRRSFTVENLKKHLLFACNSSILHDME